MSPSGCPKMWVKPCNRSAEESFPVLSLKSREQKPPNPLLIQDKNVLQPRPDPPRACSPAQICLAAGGFWPESTAGPSAGVDCRAGVGAHQRGHLRRGPAPLGP